MIYSCIRYVYQAGFLTLLIFSSGALNGMVYDNRYMPLLSRSYITSADRPSHLRAAPFALTADSAFSSGDEFTGIPEMFGFFDLGVLAKSMGEAHYVMSHELQELQDQNIPFLANGRLQGQGACFSYQQQCGSLLALGVSWLAMRSTSRQEFFTKREDVNFSGSSTDRTFDQLLREAFAILGFKEGYAHQVGAGDFDFYARLGNRWDYELKCRSIDAGFKLGLLVPAGVTRNSLEPGSIPFGGNGFWGIYGAVDAEFEVREDLKVGTSARINKRFTKNKTVRMPVTLEPSIFGAVQGCARINPGVTFIFSPYVSFEALRAGLGVRADYTLIKHQKDSWTDARPEAERTVPINLTHAEAWTSWGSDYASITVFYDFGKVKELRSFEPLLFFTWDIPAPFFVAERSAKTNRVSLGLEFSF